MRMEEWIIWKELRCVDLPNRSEKKNQNEEDVLRTSLCKLPTDRIHDYVADQKRLYHWQEKDKEKDEEDEEDEAIEPTMCMPQPIDQSSVCTTVDQIDHVVCLDTHQIANGEVKGLHASW